MFMEKIQIEKSEKKIYLWLIANRYKVVLMFLTLIFFAVISRLPYLNLIINKDTSLLLLIFIALVLFKIRANAILIIGLALFLPDFFFQIINRAETSELIANCIYILLATGAFKKIAE